MKRRPLIFWILLFAGVVAAVWWTLHIPRDPQALFRAIPAQATWLTTHEDLAGRWKDIAANPLLASVAGALEMDPEEWHEQAESEDTQAFLDLLARDEIVLAYVPEMRSTGEPAWVFSSWLGGRSQRLRWTLNSLKDPSLRQAASRNGWGVWVWSPKGMRDGSRITLALVEGMLIGCISPDTLTIEDVLACYDRQLPSLADDAGAITSLTADSADRGWFRMPGQNRWGPRVHYSLKFLPGGALAGKVYAPGAHAVAAPVLPANSLGDFSEIMRDIPSVALVADRALVRGWIEESFNTPVGREVAGLLRGEEPGAVAFSLVGDPYSGRFNAVRLPTLLAAFTADDPTQVTEHVNTAFDRLNAFYPWGLVPQLVPVGTQRVYAIESTAGSAYSKMESNERIAYAPLRESVLFSSNLEGLTKLLRDARRGTTERGRFAEGMQRMRDGHALGYLWIDLERSAKLLRLAVTAWSLKLMIEDPMGSQPTRQKLNEAKAWIDSLAPQKALEVWVRPHQDLLEYEFRLGGEE